MRVLETSDILKPFQKLGVGLRVCSFSTWKVEHLDYKLKANLNHVASVRPAWATQTKLSQNKTNLF